MCCLRRVLRWRLVAVEHKEPQSRLDEDAVRQERPDADGPALAIVRHVKTFAAARAAEVLPSVALQASALEARLPVVPVLEEQR